MGFRKFGTGEDQRVSPEGESLRVTAAQDEEWTPEDEIELHEENRRADGSSASPGQ